MLPCGAYGFAPSVLRMTHAGGRAIAALLLLAVALCAAVLPMPALAAGVPISAATPEQKAAAQTLFKRAADKSKDGDHKGALLDLQASYDIVASANTRLVISRELVALGRKADAYREAVAAVEVAKEAALQDKKYAAAETSARAEAAELKKMVGLLKVDLGGRTGELLVGGRTVPLREASDPIVVDPGEVKVTLRGLAGIDERSVTVEAGSEAAVTFAAQVAPPPPPRKKKEKPPLHPFDMGDGQRITALTLGGVGVVGMLFFAGFGSANVSIFDDLETRCPNDRCPASAREDADRGEAFRTVANVSVAFGAIGLAAGAAFLVPTFFQPDESTAWLELSPGFVGVGGRF